MSTTIEHTGEMETSKVGSRWLPWGLALVTFLMIEITMRRGLPMNPDGWWYWQGALGIIEGRGYVGMASEPIVAWPIGFSWWLSLWIRVLGDSASTLVHALAATTAVGAAGWVLLAQSVQARAVILPDRLRIWSVAIFLPSFLALHVRALHAENLLDAILPWTIWAALWSSRYWGALIAAALGFVACLMVRNSAPIFLPGLLLLILTAGDADRRHRFLRAAIFLVLALGMGILLRMLTGPGPEAMLGTQGTHALGDARLGLFSQGWELLLGIDKAFGPKPVGFILFVALCYFAWRSGEDSRRLLIFGLSALLATWAIFCLVYIHDPLEGRFLRFFPALVVPLVLLSGKESGPRWLLALLLLLLIGHPFVKDCNHMRLGKGANPAVAAKDFAPGALSLRDWRAAIPR